MFWMFQASSDWTRKVRIVKVVDPLSLIHKIALILNEIKTTYDHERKFLLL